VTDHSSVTQKSLTQLNADLDAERHERAASSTTIQKYVQSETDGIRAELLQMASSLDEVLVCINTR